MYSTVQKKKEQHHDSASDSKSLSNNQSELKTVQRMHRPNNTGIPTQMKSEFEDKSGFSFDDVKVHYNSTKPAQLQALAYTQGNQVHVGPGQERHLRHELGHVVQQKAGIVRPTGYLGGIPVNDDPGLESRADRSLRPMGAVSPNKSAFNGPLTVQRQEPPKRPPDVKRRKELYELLSKVPGYEYNSTSADEVTRVMEMIEKYGGENRSYDVNMDANWSEGDNKGVFDAGHRVDDPPSTMDVRKAYNKVEDAYYRTLQLIRIIGETELLHLSERRNYAVEVIAEIKEAGKTYKSNFRNLNNSSADVKKYKDEFSKIADKCKEELEKISNEMDTVSNILAGIIKRSDNATQKLEAYYLTVFLPKMADPNLEENEKAELNEDLNKLYGEAEIDEADRAAKKAEMDWLTPDNLWKADWLDRIYKVNTIIDNHWKKTKIQISAWFISSYGFAPTTPELTYIGSLAKGYKGPPKQHVKFDSAKFDVDANLDCPELANVLLSAGIAPDRGKVMPNQMGVKEELKGIKTILEGFQVQVQESLNPEKNGGVPGYDYNPEEPFEVAINIPKMSKVIDNRKKARAMELFGVEDKDNGENKLKAEKYKQMTTLVVQDSREAILAMLYELRDSYPGNFRHFITQSGIASNLNGAGALKEDLSPKEMKKIAERIAEFVDDPSNFPLPPPPPPPVKN